VSGLSRKQTHQVVQARDMLGLNKDSSLVAERGQWLKNTEEIARNQPELLDDYIQQAPFRYLLRTVF
jgi:hypothetical protein